MIWSSSPFSFHQFVRWGNEVKAGEIGKVRLRNLVIAARDKSRHYDSDGTSLIATGAIAVH